MPSTTSDRLNGLTTSLAIKAPCTVATTANITLSGLQTVNGVALAIDDRVLVKDQTNGVQNGIYTVSSSTWRRAKDFDGNRDVARGTLVPVVNASGAADLYEVTTANPITIGSTSIAFTLRYSANTRYERTAAEIAAGVTPVDYARAPGDIRRYGAVSGTDSRAAIQAAIDQAALSGGSDVFIPMGTWNTPSPIFLKSNVRMYGEGYSSLIQGASWTDAIYTTLYAHRDQGPHTNIILENFRVHGALNGSVPSHGHAAINIAYCTTVRLRNVIVTQADDACIRMEGYRAGTVFPLASSDPDVNADLGHLHDFVIEGCRCSGGYMGLEIEGGAAGSVLGGYFDGGTTYAIRMPRAQHVRVVGAHLYSATDQALWMDYVNRSQVIGCFIDTDDAGEPCVAIGYCKDVILADNIIRGGTDGISDAVMYAATISSGGSLRMENNIFLGQGSSSIRMWYHQDFLLRGNIGPSCIVQNNAKGQVLHNRMGHTITSTKLLAAGGADVLALGNVSPTGVPAVDDGNIGFVGSASAAPTTGTYLRGHVIFNSAPSASGFVGWVCVTAGTPGTWKTFGAISA